MGGRPRAAAPGGLLLLLLCAQVGLVAANLRADNFHSRHLLHTEHDRFYEMLAAAPAGEEDSVWHFNDENAPLVNKASIEKARVMEMADDAEADAVRAPRRRQPRAAEAPAAWGPRLRAALGAALPWGGRGPAAALAAAAGPPGRSPLRC